MARALSKSIAASTLALGLFISGCRHESAPPLPPPPITAPTAPPITKPTPAASPTPEARTRRPAISPHAKPIYVETGLATWYLPYKGRPTASGEKYDGKELTAAHKTLPLNSIARVTDLETGKSVTLRINDRGPFVGDRILDLSPAAAKAIGLWSAGIAKVKLEVLYAPTPIDRGGRWAVQIGVFTSASAAAKFKKQIERKYHSAEVLQFKGSTGQWLRVRVLHDDKARAEEVERAARPSEGQAFLVRLD